MSMSCCTGGLFLAESMQRNKRKKKRRKTTGGQMEKRREAVVSTLTRQSLPYSGYRAAISRGSLARFTGRESLAE